MGLGLLSRSGANRLAAHTGGNALYCRALLDEIGVAGLSGEHGGCRPSPIVGRRPVSRCFASNVNQNFLAAAAVLGQHSPRHHWLGAQLPTAPTDRGIRRVRMLTDDVTASELSFAHPLYRAAIYGDLSPYSKDASRIRCCRHAAGCDYRSHYGVARSR